MNEPAPRRGRIVAWSLVVAGVAAIVVAALVSYPALVEWWYGIPVVRTWRDLLEQEPIDLGGGVTVRIGIEARSAPLWSGVLVYCLAEADGILPVTSGARRLGPLELSIEAGSVPAEPELPRYSGYDVLRGGINLFAQTVAVTSQAPRRVELRSPNGKLQRFATVRTSQAAFHPWMRLDQPTTTNLLRVADENAFADAGAVAVRGEGIVVPRFEGQLPLPSHVTEAGLAIPNLPLPSLLPRAETPQIALWQLGEELEIEAAEYLIAEQAVDHFLTRFWVNDHPYSPQPLQKSSIERIGRGGNPPRAKRLRLKLELDPANLGARPGDRIGLQLLYVDGGWEHVGPGPVSQQILRFRTRDEPHRVLQSNRIELFAP